MSTKNNARLMCMKNVRWNICHMTLSCIFLFFQLLVTAFDTGAPSAVVSETVIITVNRNLNTPVFDQQDYVTTIYDYEPIGSSVVDVNAVDADITSPENLIMYNIQDSVFNINAEDTFTIHPITGLITTNRVLTSDSASVYRVRITYFASLDPYGRSA